MPDKILYDGGCGLCHGMVRFTLMRDRAAHFVYAPQKVPRSTVIVVTEDGRRLERSAAVLHILDRLGGFWRLLARIGRLIPGVWLDLGYAFIARIRYRIFGRRTDPCPLVPPELRHRFLTEGE